MPLGCSHAQSRVKLILIASTSKINISGHPTGASGIEFHYKGPDISYLLNTEEERKLSRVTSFLGHPACFIDNEKAFHRVNHEKFIHTIIKMGLRGRGTQIIKSLHLSQQASIRMEKRLSNEIEIKRGVRQEYVLSPCLFNIYTVN